MTDTTTRPQLVALEGGPMHGQWFTKGDFNEQRATALYMRRLCLETPRIATAILDYHPTERTTTRHIGRANKVERIATATIYTHQEQQT